MLFLKVFKPSLNPFYQFYKCEKGCMFGFMDDHAKTAKRIRIKLDMNRR